MLPESLVWIVTSVFSNVYIELIIDEQIQFYTRLYTTEGWDENSANKLTQHIENKLNGDKKRNPRSGR
jgi:hypothetical protein